MKPTTEKPNLLAQLAQRKLEAQKARIQRAAKSAAGKTPHSTKGLLGPSWGGRNGQGKP